MSSFVMIEGFQFIELDDRAKSKVLVWLDEVPIEYEEEDGEGNIVTMYTYFSELDEVDIQDHCFMNGYLFDKNGKTIHNLILTEHRLNEEKQNG